MKQSGGLKISLNKGSLDKSQQNQKLDLEYLYKRFTAGENILKGQIVTFDPEALDEVLLADSGYYEYVVGIALHDALFGERVKICIYGNCEVIAAENIAEGHGIMLGATVGRAYDAFQLETSVPSATEANLLIAKIVSRWYCSSTFGGDVVDVFNAINAFVTKTLPTGSHTHDHYPGKVLGKMLEKVNAGQLKKCFVWLT